MPVSDDLSVVYHQQDTDYYCGGACAQVVLDSIGAGLLDQDVLYTDNHSHSTTEGDWSTAPDGLLWTMNNLKPPSLKFNSYFVLDALAHEDSISRAIISTIHHYRVAPIALVYGWQHWVVVRGFTVSAAPNGFDDTSYSISGFMLNNPWPPTPSASDKTAAPPPPHSASDGCGTGGNRGVADEHIAYSTWQTDYMTGIPGGHWAGKFVAICAPDPPPARPGLSRPALMSPLPRNKLITPDVASTRASEGIQVYGLADFNSFKMSLQGTQTAQPVLVQRLDRLDTFYYIVPFTGAAGVTTMAVAVDALTGVYRQSVVRSAAQGSIVPLIDRNTASQLVVGKTVELPGRLGRVMVRPEALSQYSTLVWKPCLESLSPFYPFHMFTVGAHQLYVRTDGAIFSELHDNYKGI